MDMGHKIARTVLDLYASVIPVKQKPRQGEWTVLSAFIFEDPRTNHLEVVSLGAGTKCLGGADLSPKGDAVHDSHGEALARRGLKRYLLSEIEKYNKMSDGIFHSQDDFISFPRRVHFFSTHLPCGDATIRPVDEDGPSKPKKSCLGPDIHRTGAKCVTGQGLLDEHLPGSGYHVLGAVRTKPGRGPRTLSLSCSDKMLKWNVLGVSGEVLREHWFAHGIHWDSITINCHPGEEEVVKKSLKRAVLDRCPIQLEKSEPKIYTSSLPFKDDLSPDESNKSSPCPHSICWSRVIEDPLLILTEGRKYGLAKKHWDNERTLLPVCRLRLAQTSLRLLGNRKSLPKGSILRYLDLKPAKKHRLKTVMPQLWKKEDKQKDLNDFIVKGTPLILITSKESDDIPFKDALDQEFILNIQSPGSKSQGEWRKRLYKLRSQPLIITEDAAFHEDDIKRILSTKEDSSPWVILTQTYSALEIPVQQFCIQEDDLGNKLLRFFRSKAS